jgi:outer membrane immunogenic protein
MHGTVGAYAEPNTIDLDKFNKDTAALQQENAALRARVQAQAENAALRERIQAQTENAALRERLQMRSGNASLRERAAERTSVQAPQSLEPPAPPVQKADLQPPGPQALEQTLKSYNADMGVGPPPVALPIIAPTWTGLYVGGNLGYGVARNRLTSVANTATGPVGLTVGDLSGGGILGGGQIGYNWQLANWVLGLEADIQAANIGQEHCSLTCGGNIGSFITNNQLNWFATARGRAGYALDGWLWYVTGGAAVAEVQSDYAITGGTTVNGGLLRVKQNLSGFTIGAGVETQLWGGWSTKLEYLYMNLGNTDNNFTFNNAGTPATAAIHTTYQDHIFRAGFNYRWGAVPGPLAAYNADLPLKGPYAAPLSIANWQGLYIGANLGYGVGRYHLDNNLAAPGTAAQLTFGDTGAAGVLGGGQIGYNWHFVPSWVLGIEADFQGAAIKQTYCGTECDLLSVTADNKLQWFATLRPRVGYAQAGWLWYVTGGFAYARVQDDYSIAAPVAGVLLTSSSVKHDLNGWTIGGGVETKLWGNWSAKLEYLFLDLGTTQDTFTVDLAGTPTSLTTKTTYQDHIARIGLNYRFGDPAPAVAWAR